MQPNPKHTESELVALLKNKDQQAYNYLYDNYAGALYGIIMNVIGEEEMAKDVLQEVFVKIWKNIEHYDELKGRLYTWMLNIARNSAIDVLRSAKYNRDKKTAGIDNNVHMDNSSLSVTIKTDHLGIKKIVDGLKDEYRQIINLAYFKGYTQEEVAEELNIPLGTVKTRSRSALIQLKNLMQ
ncbi:sigma-70 family RNA polymerase sigma factor [Taibaiella lutea]|uniref:Sigma-70 family RNA polymerase sigma factor n=1 Tax=Taibaiella lutea TaxID=2608001 RepID=A0A5M6CHU1_9BACT|nr:sigma-70 family RNA polymerase sigma factor [Taibaiella lutea]KAA5534627.1 sigma-70 family RNA polymerase sigma factor [Taibaiella lutea]